MRGAECGVPKRSVNGEASAVLATSGVECVPVMVDIGYPISEVYDCVDLFFRRPQELSTYSKGAVFDKSVPIFKAFSLY